MPERAPFRCLLRHLLHPSCSAGEPPGTGPDEEQRDALRRLWRRLESERLAKERYLANEPVVPHPPHLSPDSDNNSETDSDTDSEAEAVPFFCAHAIA